MTNILITNKTIELDPPLTYEEIFDRPDKNSWIEAINKELKNMEEKKVFEIVNEVPKEKNLISCKWVFSYKRNDKGNITKYKARLVARGFSQVYGVDYVDTFSPTLKQDSLRIITSIAVYNNFNIYQLDIKAAYLNAEINEELYMEIPKGMDVGVYIKLKKAIYGLKQAGRLWNDKINKTLLELKFERLKSEPCVYILKDKYKNILCIIAIYVDNILIAGNNKTINKVKLEINKYFELSDIGNVDFIVGIKFIKCKDGYILHQLRYLEKILDKFKINENEKASNMINIENKKLKNRKFNPKVYMQAVGCLLYLAMGTRPDIMFATSKASRKNENPTYEDWINVLKIFKYLNYTKYYGIKISKNINIAAYVDADLGGDEETRRSTSGFLIIMGNTPITWYSKLQHCVAVSTAESEYYSLNEWALKCMWLKNLLNELGINIKYIYINVDNKAAIYNSKNESINQKSRHIDLKYHKIRELVKEEEIKLEYVKSQNNLADFLTKNLNGSIMKTLRDTLLTKIQEY